jgi:hypothetical protein
VRARLRDRVAASDPGLLRLTAGLRTVGSIALAAAVLAALDVETPALGVPVALASVRLAALPHSRVLAGDLFLVALVFGAVHSRRFGDRGTALGLIGFQLYFVSLFVGATVPDLPELYGVIGVAFVCSALTRFVILPETPAGTLERLREAFRVRLARLVSAQLELLDAGP